MFVASLLNMKYLFPASSFKASITVPFGALYLKKSPVTVTAKLNILSNKVASSTFFVISIFPLLGSPNIFIILFVTS